MSDPQDELFTALVQAARADGYSEAEAKQLALKVTQQFTAVDAGCTWGRVQPEMILTLWQRAAQHGKRRLLLEIVAEGDHQDAYDGHIEVRVIEHQTWQDYEAQLQPGRVSA